MILETSLTKFKAYHDVLIHHVTTHTVHNIVIAMVTISSPWLLYYHRGYYYRTVDSNGVLRSKKIMIKRGSKLPNWAKVSIPNILACCVASAYKLIFLI